MGKKIRMDLLPPSAIKEVADVLTFGAQKYGEDDWRIDLSGSIDKIANRFQKLEAECIAASLRHIFSYIEGYIYDDETGNMHLAHAVCRLLFILQTQIDINTIMENKSSFEEE